MADGLATAALLFLLPLALIAAGVALWVHRPQRNEHEAASRVQPLFTSDLVIAKDPEDDDAMMADMPDPRAPAMENATGTRPNVAVSASFAPPARPVAAVRPAMPQRPIAPAPRAATASHASPNHASPNHASPNHASPNHALQRPSYSPGYPQASAPRAMQPSANVLQTPAQQPLPARANLQQAWADGQAVRFNVPVDGTLQFLPGRLEIVSGQEPEREVRFVRLPDSPEPEITFGRNEGAIYRHVQLRDATVSRLHARMGLRSGAWTLTNLSTTNPVMLNGAVLGDGEAHVLADGDRVEMGEVVFRFRTR